jgi:hypothetical protein
MTMRTTILLSLALVAGCYNPDIPDNGFACHNDPSCPSGFSCQGGFCVKSAGGGPGLPQIMIPKSGAPYSGPHTDPMLDDASACPDANLEPNDGPDPNGHPLAFTPMPDQQTAKIIKLAICPTGNNPLTGKHDVDFFKVDNSTGPSSLTLMAEAFYDISKGDLDIGIYDAQLNPLSVDGTAVTNGCTSAAITNQVYYVVVAGANNVDVNTYELLIRSFSMPKTCPTM